MEKAMFLLACQLRMMNLFYHSAHNLTKGPNFEGDHEMFSDFYTAIIGDYDSIVERAIGMDMETVGDVCEQLKVVYTKLEKLPKTSSNDEKFEIGLNLEKELCKIVQAICSAKVSPGVEQLVGEMGNQSEIRQYKIKQRLK